MIPAKHQLLRITVVSPFGQHDIDLLAMAGLHPSPARLAADGWHLADPAGRPISQHGTLADHGVGPGSVIQLRRPDPSADNGVQMRAGVGMVRDSAAVSRHLPRAGVPLAPPPDDHLTPLQRVDAMMPQRVGRVNRLLGAGTAFLRETEPPAHAPLPEPAAPGAAGPAGGPSPAGSSPSPSGYFPDDAPVAAPGALENTDPGTIPAARTEPIMRIGPHVAAGPSRAPAKSPASP